ncbi:hypothetical protein AN958_11977 [Leucoagaricus sp. SymC.cos]|nr:hypothetical protein AN958_11977 [Leucoagaricus sp. SymC.cos]
MLNPTRNHSLASDFSPEELEPSASDALSMYNLSKLTFVSVANPWEECYEPVRRHDKEMCERWRDEMDKLLIFAGLFSAAVTAFAVEGFKMLQPDPTMTLAAVIAAGNQTAILSNFKPESSAIRINIFLLLSLVLSLSTVIVGVLSMQWLREYQRSDSTSAAEDALGLRQMCYQGLLAWRVPEIIGLLPLLLQTAVFLFFCGILDLLWSLHRVVAIVVTIPIGLLAIFLVTTTALPVLQYTFTRKLNLRVPQCPFKSPQSWMFHRLSSFISVLIFQFTEFLNIKSLFRYEIRERRSLIRKLFAAPDWRTYDQCWRQRRDLQLNRSLPGGLVGHTVVREDIAHALSWIINSFSRDLNYITHLYRCFQLMGDNEKEAMLLSCERVTPLSVDFRNKLGGEGVPAVSDYLCIRALDHLLSATGYGSDATRDLLQHRVELYVRVMRASIHLPRRPMLYCPFRYYSRFSDEVQILFLHIATMFLSRSDRESDFATAIVIFSQTTNHPAMRTPTARLEGLGDVHDLLGHDHISGNDDWEELRRTYSNALADATGQFLHRPEIIAQTSVRVQLYRWFLRTILSTSSTNTVFDMTLPVFKAIAPIIRSSIPSSVPVEAEYPTNPTFKVAWKMLLEGKYTELAHVPSLASGLDESSMGSLSRLDAPHNINPPKG